MENTAGLAFMDGLLSLLGKVSEITNENNITQETSTDKNINIKTKDKNIERPNIKRTNDERIIINNSHTVINGDININIGSINIEINNGAYHKTSSNSNKNLGYNSSDDYWIQENEKYNKAVSRFYKSNF